MINNPHIYQDVFCAMQDGLSRVAGTSKRHNAMYKTDDFHRHMMQACAHNAQVAGCARSSAAMAGTGPGRDGRPRGPTGEWIRGVAARADAVDVCRRFEYTVSSQIRQLHETGRLHRRKKITAAIDMHLIPRYDKKYGAELVRAKRKNGTHVFERYITIHCVDNGRRLALGMAHMPALEDTADFVRKVIESAVRAGARIDTIMMDREFFSADVMAAIDALGIWYLIPCRNTDTVVCALGEFAAGRRGRVSESVIVGGDGREVPYTMLIARRKKKRKGSGDGEPAPHEKYIGFATNRPETDPDLYENRWGIETAYRMIEGARIRTHSKNPAVRLLYFAYSVAVFNAWVVANAILGYITGIHAEKESLISQQHFKNMMLSSYLFDCRMLPEPPPPAPI